MSSGPAPSNSLRALFRVSSLLCRATTPDLVLRDVLLATCDHACASSGLVTLVESDGEDTLAIAAFVEEHADGSNLSPGAPPSAASQWICENDRPLLLPSGVGDDARFADEYEFYQKNLPFAGVPIRNAAGVIVGTLELQPRTTPESFQELTSFLEMVSSLIGQHSGADFQVQKTPGGDQPTERGQYRFDNLVGRTPSMRRIFTQVRQVAKWNTTVLVMGESGTGKELIANAIHHNSPRARGPFIKLNCAALPDNLLESELFGHEKGAFTGALTRHTGRFEKAHRGTLFLDEIGEISPSFQAKLLRVLQEGEYERLGGTQTLHVDVRVIAATNRDLEQQVEEGKFRQDLFYRLNVMPIFTPALRERKEDIPDLVNHLISKISKSQQRKLQVTAEAQLALQEHDWPGNVRELENCLERAAVMSDSGFIDEDVLAAAGVAVGGAGSAGGMNSSTPSVDFRDPTIDERERLLAALERAGWVQAKAARLLGMTPRQVAYRIQILKIDIPRF